MRRKRLTRKGSRRLFRKTAMLTKKVNVSSSPMRGGTRM